MSCSHLTKALKEGSVIRSYVCILLKEAEEELNTRQLFGFPCVDQEAADVSASLRQTDMTYSAFWTVGDCVFNNVVRVLGASFLVNKRVHVCRPG